LIKSARSAYFFCGVVIDATALIVALTVPLIFLSEVRIAFQKSRHYVLLSLRAFVTAHFYHGALLPSRTDMAREYRLSTFLVIRAGCAQRKFT
jgi:hypothetical protein